jgi:gliding motility-associated transport system permease protein
MRNVWIVCRKELRSYFVSPIAYLLLAIFAFIFGYIFSSFIDDFLRYTMAMRMRGESVPLNLNEEMIRPLLGNTGFVGLLLIPMITMRLFAEEKRNGTIELLATSPIRDFEVVLGKWLASLLLYGFMLALTGLNLIWLFKYGNPDWKPLAIGYLGLLLEAGALLAIGTFISTLTRNQIVAGGASFAVSLLLWLAGWAGSGGYDSGTMAQVFSYLSLLTHYESFSKGVLSLKDAIFYVTLSYLGLFLTVRSVESLRWRS